MTDDTDYEFTHDLLKELNPDQREAATVTEGFVRVVAGAGTGKTKALTHRYAYLVGELGISPSNILCITFTNKAASEMKRRIKAMLGSDFDTSFVATLHAFCTRVLREDISKLFYPENFIILDNADMKKILEEVYDELHIKMDTASFKFMIDQIRYYKNLIKYVEYLSDPSFDYDTLTSEKKSDEIMFHYIKKQRKYFGLDFFDLINFTIYLFNTHPDILEKWQNRLHYVMVDEFQDITVKEFKQIRRLCEVNQNLFVVGDPDQNIYEWRGSKMDVLVDYEGWLNNDWFPVKINAVVHDVIMSENYRSVQPLLDAANDLIAKNKNRVEKELSANREGGVKPVYLHAKNEKDEIKFICGVIKEHIAAGGKYSDFAVLYRSNFVSRFAEQGFLTENIPYAIYGGVGFYERAEIKDVLSYMRLTANPDDDLSFLRVINVPRRKIGKAKLDVIKSVAESEKISLFDALRRCAATEEFRTSGARRFIRIMDKLRGEAKTLSVSELLQKLLLETGYELYIRESGDIERLDNVTELLQSIVAQETEFGEPLSLTVFLQNVTLLRDSDVEGKADAVKLMTIHTAKGLEFDTVFLTGMTEGILPSARALEERKSEALEEERRLAFVAMTRAKNRLYLTESEGFGVKGYSKVPSRFILDINEALLDYVNPLPDSLKNETVAQARAFDKLNAETLTAGSQVRHKVFGEGIIESVDEKTKTYYIRFVNGIKPISFTYAGLSHVY